MEQNQTQQRPSDEIDLRELACALWSQKLAIVACTLVVTCIAAAYAFFSTPVYETTAQTLPPTASHLASYNAASQVTGGSVKRITELDERRAEQNGGISAITPKDAYAAFLKHLTSDTVRRNFFDQYYLPAQKRQEGQAGIQALQRQLDDELTITTPKKENEFVAKVTLEGTDPDTIATWANAYVDLAMTAVRNELLNDLAGEVEVRQKGVNDQIAALRKVAETITKNRIARTESALAIAESIGLDAPPAGTPLIAIAGDNISGADTFANGSMMYLRGANALRSELEQLRSGGAEDAYIPELPNLLKTRELLQSIELQPAVLAAATIDRVAAVPEDPIKPKKLLILVLGVILGGMLGLFWAIARLVFRPRSI